MDELVFTQCPLCGRWVLGGIRAHRCEGEYVFRWDCCSHVCVCCDRDLGPDTERVKAARLSPNMSEWLKDYLAKW